MAKEITTLREKTEAELQAMLAAARTTVQQAQFAVRAGKNNRVTEWRSAKKTIARVQTLLRQTSAGETSKK